MSITEPPKRSRKRPTKRRLQSELKAAIERAMSDPIGYAREEAAKDLVTAMQNVRKNLKSEDDRTRDAATKIVLDLAVGKPGTQPPPIDPEAKKIFIVGELPLDESLDEPIP